MFAFHIYHLHTKEEKEELKQWYFSKQQNKLKHLLSIAKF